MAKHKSYREIAEAIRQEWIVNCTEEGARLPTERELQLRMGVSRVTISRAMHLLAEQGIIEQRRGSGTYVRHIGTTAPPKPTLGFIAPYIAPAGFYSGPLPSLVHMGIEERAGELGYQVISAASHYSVDTESQLIDHFRVSGAVGVILMPVTSDPKRSLERAHHDPLARRWRDTPIAVVDLGAPAWGRPMVCMNNYRLGYDMTVALIRHGCRRILFMDTNHSALHTSIHARRAGYQRAMEVNGLPIPPAYRLWPLTVTDFRPDLVLRLAAQEQLPGFNRTSDQDDMQLLRQLTDSLLTLDPLPDAVIAWEDATAMGLIRQVIERGIRVPDELRITGFDNHMQGRYFQPAFPTSNPDLRLMGQYAVDMVDQMVAGVSPRLDTIQIPVNVLWRE